MSCMQCINSVKLSNYVGFEFLVIVQTIQNILYFGTENPEFLDSHIVQLSLSESYNTLPDIDTNYLKTEENQEADLNVTVFRALSSPKKSKKSKKSRNQAIHLKDIPLILCMKYQQIQMNTCKINNFSYCSFCKSCRE